MQQATNADPGQIPWCCKASLGHNELISTHQGPNKMDDISKSIFFDANVCINIKVSLNFVPDSQIQLVSLSPDHPGRETSARPLANASGNLAARVENKPGWVEFCIGYIREYPVQASATKF